MKRRILTVLLSGILAVALPLFAEGASEDPNDPNSVVIEYIGNSCFKFTLPDGKTIITDPYGKSLETAFAPRPGLKADIVTVSHLHTDHTGGIDDVEGNPRVIMPNDASAPQQIGSVEITGIAASHILGMGNNTLFVYKTGGLKIVHMVETDKPDSPAAVDAITNADVVLMYAGELGSVKNGEVYASLKKMGVKIVIPQHYSMVPNAKYYNEPYVSDILAELPMGTNVKTLDRLVLTKNSESGFVVLKPMGLRK